MSNLNNEFLQVEVALDIAVEAHKGQKDKAGNEVVSLRTHPYIYHPFRISTKMDTEEEKIVALLHDVLEDSNITEDNLVQQGFSDNVITALKYLTKIKEQGYLNDYIKAIKTNKLATKVKIADLIDNINLSRLKVVTVKDINRTRKYLDALEYLLSDEI